MSCISIIFSTNLDNSQNILIGLKSENCLGKLGFGIGVLKDVFQQVEGIFNVKML